MSPIRCEINKIRYPRYPFIKQMLYAQFPKNCKLSRHKTYMDDRNLTDDVFKGFYFVNYHFRSSGEVFKQTKLSKNLTVFLCQFWLK